MEHLGELDRPAELDAAVGGDAHGDRPQAVDDGDLGLASGDDGVAETLVLDEGRPVVQSPVADAGVVGARPAPDVDRKRLFNQMLVWGLSMCIVGAIVCYIFFGLLI